MTRLDSLRNAKCLSDVAVLLGYKPSALAFILYQIPSQEKYRTFDIPKRNGGVRVITAPTEKLKRLQRKLGDLLQDCAAEIEVRTGVKDRAAFGFRRGSSIFGNAARHRNSRWILNADLKDFFPTINFGRTRGYFLKNKEFSLSAPVATVLAQIACHQNALPQGSPCSPIISNLICHILDIRLIEVARNARCTYSRYVDDLTFSCNLRAFPSTIAVNQGAGQWSPGRTLQRQVERCGFRLNPEKTRCMYRQSKQEVTGLIVNRRINVPHIYRRNVRAMVNRLTATGICERFDQGNRTGTINELRGMLSFIAAADQQALGKPTDSAGLTGAEATYARFLCYAHFHASPVPVVLCEGRTDYIYLKHAIRSLATQFPDLADSASRPPAIRVKLYANRNQNTNRLLRLRDGGASNLAAFFSSYRKAWSRFNPQLSASALVIVFDTDAGCKPLVNCVKQTTGSPVDLSACYTHIFPNIYLVPVPRQNSRIEDLFDAALLSTVLGGKTFHPDESGFDSALHYGKRLFAEQVVAKGGSSVEFSGFRPLLSNIASVLKVHAAAKGATAQSAAAP